MLKKKAGHTSAETSAICIRDSRERLFLINDAGPEIRDSQKNCIYSTVDSKRNPLCSLFFLFIVLSLPLLVLHPHAFPSQLCKANVQTSIHERNWGQNKVSANTKRSKTREHAMPEGLLSWCQWFLMDKLYWNNMARGASYSSFLSFRLRSRKGGKKELEQKIQLFLLWNKKGIGNRYID